MHIKASLTIMLLALAGAFISYDRSIQSFDPLSHAGFSLANLLLPAILLGIASLTAIQLTPLPSSIARRGVLVTGGLKLLLGVSYFGAAALAIFFIDFNVLHPITF